MKHIQVIDDALNCTYPIYAVTEQEFALLFPAPGQDIEFAEDVKKRLGKRMGELMAPIWKRWVDKPDVVGIHGTLFYHHGENYQRDIFPKKRSYEMNASPETLDEVVRLRTIRKERWTQKGRFDLDQLDLPSMGGAFGDLVVRQTAKFVAALHAYSTLQSTSNYQRFGEQDEKHPDHS